MSPDYSTYDPPGRGVCLVLAVCFVAVALGIYLLCSCL